MCFPAPLKDVCWLVFMKFKAFTKQPFQVACYLAIVFCLIFRNFDLQSINLEKHPSVRSTKRMLIGKGFSPMRHGIRCMR